MKTLSAPPAVGALHDSFLQRALRRFYERAVFDVEEVEEPEQPPARMVVEPVIDDCLLGIRWFGRRYVLRVPRLMPFSAQERRLAGAIAAVLAARYRAVLKPALLAQQSELFSGVIEDRYVGASLDGAVYEMGRGRNRADRIASAIEVLRVAALSTYESRTISTGLLLLSTDDDPTRPQLMAQPGAHSYSHALTEIKSFFRLADGQRTLFLVARDGALIDIIDVERWAAELNPEVSLASPCARSYMAHARATHGNSHVCLVLSPTQEMKIFAEGAQLFTFRNADWHLLDLHVKYELWARAVGRSEVAERLFRTALDLADVRKGALFVVLENPAEAVPLLISPGDLMETYGLTTAHDGSASGGDLRYLLAGRTVTELDPSVFAALASVDGAVVTDRSGQLLAVGAILRHPPPPDDPRITSSAGARTTAAVAASRFGPVLKISEDGIITFYHRNLVWEI
jgi:hypothetical protein